ncbi:MAG: NUDIX domain-containing protein [Nanoarchaeota archaeon]
MKSEKSCGGIIFRKEKDTIFYLIIKHNRQGGGHWDFPKGHVEKGESEEDTARREIFEEVGLEVRFVEGFRESILYVNHINNINKTVVFFLCEAVSSKVEYHCDEIEKHLWLEYDDAVKRLTYENAVNLLKKASSFLKDYVPLSF